MFTTLTSVLQTKGFFRAPFPQGRTVHVSQTVVVPYYIPRSHGLGKRDEHPAYTPARVGPLYFYLTLFQQRNRLLPSLMHITFLM